MMVSTLTACVRFVLKSCFSHSNLRDIQQSNLLKSSKWIIYNFVVYSWGSGESHLSASCMSYLYILQLCSAATGSINGTLVQICWAVMVTIKITLKSRECTRLTNDCFLLNCILFVFHEQKIFVLASDHPLFSGAQGHHQQCTLCPFPDCLIMFILCNQPQSEDVTLSTSNVRLSDYLCSIFWSDSPAQGESVVTDRHRSSSTLWINVHLFYVSMTSKKVIW